MDALIESLLGPVEVMAPARVVSILRKQDSFVVVTADGRELEAAQVACNLAPADLLSLIDLPDEWAARARAIKPSGNAHQLRIALGRPLVDEGCLIGGLTLDGLTLDDLSIDLMQRTVADIEQGRVTDPLAIYAPVPSNYDASLAPPGRQLIIASVYGPVLDHPIDPPERWRDRALAALARVIPHFEEELLFCELMPVPAVGRFMGKGGRGAISNGQFPGQVGADRLPVTTPIPGLFLCGDGAGGRGIGTELAASSGMEAAAAMLSAA
jgi:prolycopene isomerase